MKKSQLIFKAIDVVCEKSQNPFNYDNIYCIRDIPFNNEDKALTCGDLYFNPLILKDGKKHPIIVNIHGGGFVMGDKRYRKTLCEYYASKDNYVFNINHRLPPAVDIFGCLNDVVDAVNYVEKLAEEYSIDLNKIVVTGDSSGAYLASQIMAIKSNPILCEKTKAKPVNVDIAALLLHSGPYDMVTMMSVVMPMGIIPELASLLVGYDLKEDMSDIKDYKYYDYMSPIDFVNEKWCPTFISWSDSDMICTNQGRPMAEKLMKYCPKVSTFYAEGLSNGHCFHLSMKKDISMQCLENSMKFIESLFAEKETVIA
ncbi:MAG: alpha/beta hydrolase [Clostridia bacterium]|nr:alpha/beta hydrolase [Clostridia bacterium]